MKMIKKINPYAVVFFLLFLVFISVAVMGLNGFFVGKENIRFVQILTIVMGFSLAFVGYKWAGSVHNFKHLSDFLKKES